MRWGPAVRGAVVTAVGSGGVGREGGLHRRGGPEGAEHLHRGNRGQGQLRGDIGGDARQSQHPDVDHLPGVADLLQVATSVVAAAQSETPPGRCLVERLAPGGELGTDGRG